MAEQLRPVSDQLVNLTIRKPRFGTQLFVLFPLSGVSVLGFSSLEVSLSLLLRVLIYLEMEKFSTIIIYAIKKTVVYVKLANIVFSQ